MTSELLKLPKRVIDLALSAGRKRQSPRTGFVHDVPDTIPLYENFCFALTLFRHKTTESVLEGKGLLQRLLSFQASEGNFPGYLHEFPECRDHSMSLRIAPILVQIERHFGSVLGTEMKEKIRASIERLIQFASGRQWSPMWEQRYLALRQETADFTAISATAISAEEWFETLISAQLLGEEIGNVPYHQGLAAFIGGKESQEQAEPSLWPIEWILAEKEGFSQRLLRDHLAALRAAAAFPVELPALSSGPYACVADTGGVRWLWGNSKLHSLSAPNGHLEGNRIVFSLADPVEPGKGALIEAALFCDLSPETEVFIEERRGMIFHLGEQVKIRTPEMTFTCRFHLIDGSGDFLGQISRGNRPAQTACKGNLRYEVFDWQIAIRTLRRSPGCRLAACYEKTEGAAAGEDAAGLRCKAALSTASPIACMPLST